MAARRSGRAGGRGPAVTKPAPARAGLAGVPVYPTCGEIEQEKNNAGFGKNGGTLVVLSRATDARQGSASAERQEPCLEGRWEKPVRTIAFGEDTPKGHQRRLEFISATYRIRASAAVPLQAALPQNRDCFSRSNDGTGWKRNAVSLNQEPAWSHLPVPA